MVFQIQKSYNDPHQHMTRLLIINCKSKMYIIISIYGNKLILKAKISDYITSYIEKHTLLLLTMITTESQIDPCKATDLVKTQAHRS